MKCLVTGGTGRLAYELIKHLEADYCGIEDWDFTYNIPTKEYDLIVHMGAYTDVQKAEKEIDKCFMVNTYGTFNISKNYPNTPIIYISTEYAYKPLGVYAKTKRWGEEIIKDHTAPYLILRTLFKPTPFPFEYAYEDQYTQGDYVDVISKVLANFVNTWDRKTSETTFLGTGRKTLFELAQRTRPDVKPNKVSNAIIPHDYKD